MAFTAGATMSAPQDPAAPKKKSSKVLVMTLAAVLLAGGGGGAWWWTHRGGESDDEEAAAHAAAEKKKHAKPLFTTLDPFTVNLQDPRGERMAQIGLTLQFTDPHVEADIRDHLPAIRNEVLLLISSKQIDELLTVDGKKLLAAQIRTRAARAMGIELPEDDAVAPEPAKAASKPVAHAEAEDADEEEPKPKPKKKKKKARPVVENPIQQVLFSQFIVQ
jgi:flagellar FliL protein